MSRRPRSLLLKRSARRSHSVHNSHSRGKIRRSMIVERRNFPIPLYRNNRETSVNETIFRTASAGIMVAIIVALIIALEEVAQVLGRRVCGGSQQRLYAEDLLQGFQRRAVIVVDRVAEWLLAAPCGKGRQDEHADRPI